MSGKRETGHGELQLKKLNLRLKRTFATSQAAVTEKPTLLARWRNGIGEGAPSIHYGPGVDDLVAEVELRADSSGKLDVGESFRAFCAGLPVELNVGRCALEMSYLDHCAKQRGVPLYSFLNLKPPDDVRSSITISYGSEKEIETQMEEAGGFSRLKLKVGFVRDLWFIDQVLGIREASLRLDANGGWSGKQALERVKSLAGYPVEFIEEPIAEPKLKELDRLKSRADFPVFLDESVVDVDDLEQFQEVIDGVNVKLAKCGGVQKALRLAEKARLLGKKLLLGCMIESAVGITAALNIASVFDCFDLDAIMLTQDTPFRGALFDDDRLLLPEGAGIAVAVDEDVFV